MKLFHALLTVGAAASAVKQVNDNNFKDVVLSSGRTTLVDFYADWCRHCKTLLPTIDKLADEFSQSEEIQIVKVNGDGDGKRMRKKYNVNGYPTLLLFKSGLALPLPYEGLRDQESISNFINLASGFSQDKAEKYGKGQALGVLTPLLDANLTQFADRAETTLVLVQDRQSLSESLLQSWRNIAELPVYRESRATFLELHLTDPKQFLTEYNVTHLPIIINANSIKDKIHLFDVYLDRLDVPDLVRQYLEIPNAKEEQQEGNLGRIFFIDKQMRFTSSRDGENLLDDVIGLNDPESPLYNLLIEKYNPSDDENLDMLPYYSKIIAKILSDDSKWLKNELIRLQTMTERSGKLISNKDAEFAVKRINILKAVVAGRRI